MTNHKTPRGKYIEAISDVIASVWTPRVFNQEKALSFLEESYKEVLNLPKTSSQSRDNLERAYRAVIDYSKSARGINGSMDDSLQALERTLPSIGFPMGFALQLSKKISPDELQLS